MHAGKKHHKGRHHKAVGGKMESASKGDDTWAQDEKDKPMDYTASNKVAGEAEERKHGGRAKRKHGGMVHHLGKLHGKKPHHHAGRHPRKSGGRTGGSDTHPMSSAHRGTQPRNAPAGQYELD